MTPEKPFKLTYATMFNPPEELHTRFEAEMGKLKSNLGREYGMIVQGEDRFSAEKFESRSPINTDMVLGVLQKGTAADVDAALSAARAASKLWRKMDWQDRVRLLRKAADLIDQRLFEISAMVVLEVGKNRMEALGDVAETADLIRYSCQQLEDHNGFLVEMGRDPLVGYSAKNTSTLEPYGVWVVISPFNFPTALSGGPVGAALVAGNTVVLKPATDTPVSVRLLAECFRDAGLPPGVINFITGPGSTVGQRLIESDQVDGITFTGSFAVGMNIYRTFSQGRYPRPVILEMGGKNPTIVSRHADLERAAQGIVRSAFGLQGQKCSACSRVFVEAPQYDALLERLTDLTKKLTIGNPEERSVFNGPVINRNSYNDYIRFCEELNKAGQAVTGGKVLKDGEFSKGFFCPPTIYTDVPMDHPLWKHEMFIPITMIHKVANLDEAMALANDVDYGLTSGFYGSVEEAEWFFDNIEAGVNYANRPQGATTGAWPGFQPFGGWKGSGSSGKNAGGYYYLQHYMHEKIRTIIS